MSAQAITRLPMDSSRALMFTDARGHVVFVDNNFIKLTGRAAGSSVVGVPMHVLLGIEAEAALTLLREISQTGQLAQKPIELRDASGATLRVECTGVATYDERKSFIGADLALMRSAAGPAQEVAEPEPLAEIIEDALDLEYAARLKAYFLAHIRAQRELVAHIGGDHLRRSLNSIINETASRNEWPILIEGEVFFVEVNHQHIETYRGMLARVISYAVNVIGVNLVDREYRKVNQQLDAGTVETGQSLDLSALFVDQK